MSEERWLRVSEGWQRLLLWLYPADFREEMGGSMLEAYRDRCRVALARGGVLALVWLWFRAFGDSLRNGVGERLSPSIAWRRTGNWGRDAELVLRRLVRAPVFVATMVGTLAVGLGAFAVVYTAVDRVLLAPLPYENPDDLYFVWREYGWFELDRGWLSGPDIAALDEAGGPIEAAVGMALSRATLAPTAGAEPEEVPFLVSSPELFDVLGVRPMLGRTFAADEVGPDSERVIVLGYDLWRTRFGGDPTILGSTVRTGVTEYTVIGVMGPGFRFRMHSSLGPPVPADAYITFSSNLAEAHPGSGNYAGLLRARPGSSPAAVASAVAAVAAMIDERDFDNQGLHLYPVGMKDDLVARVRPALTVLGLAGVFLVLVLMVNLASLLLVRAAQREREFAISRALGANRLALIRAMFLEGGVLGMLGGAAAAVLAVWGTRMLVSLAPPELPRSEAIAVDARIAAIVIGVGLLVGLLAAALPAIWATRTRLTALLASAAVRGGGGGSGRARRTLVVLQVALSLVLLSAGGLVVRSFGELLRTDPGFHPEGVLTFRVPIPVSAYPELADAAALQRRIRDELSALPGVRAVGATNALPLAATPSQNETTFPGAPGNTGDSEHDAPLVDWVRATPGYFEAMGIRVLAGRGFEDSPRQGREVLIDRTLAQHFFLGADPLGFQIPWGEDELATVVGVVEHVRYYDVHQDGRPQLYFSLDDMPLRHLSYVVQADRTPRGLMPDVRRAIQGLDAGLAVSEMRPMEQIVSESMSQHRLSAVLISGFGLGALLLAAMGLFGVVAGTVLRRSHEIAVRLALGADHRRVLRLVFGEGVRLVLVGIALGVPGIYVSAQVIRGVLVGVSPFDPLTLGAVAAGLALVALAACYLPARRVAGVESAGLLRDS